VGAYLAILEGFARGLRVEFAMQESTLKKSVKCPGFRLYTTIGTGTRTGLEAILLPHHSCKFFKKRS